MPKQSFAIERNGSKRLELWWDVGWRTPWDIGWRTVIVKLDAIEIGRIEGGQKALQEGRQIALPDGRMLTIQLNRNWLTANLEVKINGKPLPGSSTDPEQILLNAYGILFVVAGLNIILGVVAWTFEIRFLQSFGMGPASVFFGLVFLILGLFTRQKNLVALSVAIMLFTIDGIVGFFVATSAGTINGAGLVIRLFFLIFMIRGLRAIRELQQEQVERRRLRRAEKERY